MNTEIDLHPAVRIEGNLIVITEDNVTLSLDDIAAILVELHRRGFDIKSAWENTGTSISLPKGVHPEPNVDALREILEQTTNRE